MTKKCNFSLWKCIIWHLFSFRNIIVVYIAQTFALIIHCTNIKLCLETTCLPFLFTVYFIPAWLLINRGSEKHPFQGCTLMYSGYDYYTSFAILLIAPFWKISSNFN